MAFVKEKILGTDNEDLYNSFDLCFSGNKIEIHKYTSWVVDKERGIYFTYLGGNTYDMWEVYALIWKNKKMIVSIEARGYSDGPHWLVDRMRAPKDLEPFKEELVAIIKEAAQAMHDCKLTFQCFSDPLFVKEDIIEVGGC